MRKLPYRLHLVFDVVGALDLAAAGATRRDPVDRFVPVGVGVYELGAVLLSDPGGGRRIARSAVTVNRSEAEIRAFLADPANVRALSPDGSWTGEYELRPAPGGRGTEIHANAPPADLRRASQLLEAGELATADGGPAGRRGALSAVLGRGARGRNRPHPLAAEAGARARRRERRARLQKGRRSSSPRSTCSSSRGM